MLMCGSCTCTIATEVGPPCPHVGPSPCWPEVRCGTHEIALHVRARVYACRCFNMDANQFVPACLGRSEEDDPAPCAGTGAHVAMQRAACSGRPWSAADAHAGAAPSQQRRGQHPAGFARAASCASGLERQGAHTPHCGLFCRGATERCHQGLELIGGAAGGRGSECEHGWRETSVHRERLDWLTSVRVLRASVRVMRQWNCCHHPHQPAHHTRRMR